MKSHVVDFNDKNTKQSNNKVSPLTHFPMIARSELLQPLIRTNELNDLSDISIDINDKKDYQLLSRTAQSAIISQYFKPKSRSYKKNVRMLSEIVKAQNEIRESIYFLKSGIRKRKRPIYFLMGFMMVGTGIYLLLDLYLYFQFKMHEEARLSNHLGALNEVYPQLLNLTQQTYEGLSQTMYDVQCYFPITDWYSSTISYLNGTFSCNWRASTNECWDHSQAVGNEFCNPYNIDYYGGNPYPVFPKDLCPSWITDWCFANLNLRENIADRENVFYQLENLNDIFHGWIGNALNYYVIFLVFGELAPLVILGINLLSNVFSNFLSSVGLSFNLSKNHQDIIQRTAARYEINQDNLESYYLAAQDFEKKLLNFNERKVPFTSAREERLIFISGAKIDDNEDMMSPLSLLFRHPRADLQLVAMIFDMAGISNSAIANDLTDSARHTFEMGSYIKNNLAGNALERDNPLYCFFNRLKSENWDDPDKEKTYLKKTSKHSALSFARDRFFYKTPVHQAREVIRNIYEFADFTPMRGK
ncbi:MAG: hypothetical protein ABI370_03620 [Gammaproteobacteria bacterium]